jgi:DNA-binding XRE family transcriptional regulator
VNGESEQFQRCDRWRNREEKTWDSTSEALYLAHQRFIHPQPMPPRMQIGTRLRQLRYQHQLSSRQTADRAGVSQSTYLDWEQDKTSPTLSSFTTGSRRVGTGELPLGLQVKDF